MLINRAINRGFRHGAGHRSLRLSDHLSGGHVGSNSNSWSFASLSLVNGFCVGVKHPVLERFKFSI